MAKRTKGLFDVSSQQEALVFLQHNNIQVLERDKLLHSGASTANGFDGVATMEDVYELWKGFARVRQHHAPAPLLHEGSINDTNMAIDLLKDSVEKTGLNMLRVPLPLWTSSDHLQEVAHTLVKANQDMQTITSWDGQVLGLKGHVNLFYGSPYNIAMASTTEDGFINIQAGSEMLAHEGLHGIDFMMAMRSGYKGESDLDALMTDALIHSHNHPHIEHDVTAQIWNGLINDVNTHMSGWEQRVLQQADTMGGVEELLIKEYALSPREKIAYALEGFASYKLGAQSTVTFHGDTHLSVTPNKEEAQQSAFIWENVFQDLKTSFWDTLPSAHIDISYTTEEYNVPPLSKDRLTQARAQNTHLDISQKALTL